MLTPVDDAPALIAAGTELGHAALCRQVDELASSLPDAALGRLLIQAPLRAEVSSVVAYLAALRAGHVVLVTAGDPAQTAAIVERYHPDLLVTNTAVDPFQPLGAYAGSGVPQHLLHPDLDLLLSTSGSTGSPKLVRLSRENVISNASAIATALQLTPQDRAITSLPLHYCFGLSVLHSHLAVGASVVLHEGSVLDTSFWDTVDRDGVTTLAVVPHMVELMERSGVLEQPHPSLRLITQAGGAMGPERVRRTARTGRERRWELAVMYGQTEATARICIMPPALVEQIPDAVGRPIPGTTLHLDESVPEAAAGVGEVVVRGPGVMMGYADHPDDLALGRMQEELRTGDLGHMDGAGLLHIVGRRSGFVKIMGLRVDLTSVEAALDRAGLTACVTGDDSGLRIAVEPVPGTTARALASQARRVAARSASLAASVVQVRVGPLPRRPNGKADRAAADAWVRSAATGVPPDTGGTLESRVVAALASILARDTIDLAATFVEEGGDSLSHVQAGVRLQALLGDLPPDWHHRPLRELITASEPPEVRSTTPGVVPRLRKHVVSVDTSAVLRAVTAVMICGTHAHLFHLVGGAHVLLAIAGFSVARFGLSAARVADRWRSVTRLIIGIAVPASVVALVGLVTVERYAWPNVFLVNWLIGDIDDLFHNEFWFIEAMIACLVVVALLLTVPPVARVWRRDPWLVAFVIAALALIPRFWIIGTVEAPRWGIMPTVLWLFAVGAAFAVCQTAPRRWATLAVAAVGCWGFFENDPGRNLVILGGVAMLGFVRQVWLPRFLLPVIMILAAASLHIYLVQFQVFPWFGEQWVETLAGLTAGVLLWRISDRPVRRLQDFLVKPGGPRHHRTPVASAARI